MSSQNQNPYLPTSFKYDEETLIPRLQDNYFSIASAINRREVSLYTTAELRNGVEWQIGNEQHGVLRKVIDFGTLPNATTKNVAHNITTNTNTFFTKIYGVSKDPSTPQWIPLPFASTTSANNISLLVNNTNVVITTGVDRTAFTETYIVLEYWQA
jgi:hypothetical protein